MAQQIINIGSAPNDGSGDQLRISFDKCNGNFTELYAGVAANVPTGNTIEYLFNNATTEPPLAGQVRFNQAVQASTTKLWVSQTTSSGINIKQFLSAATTGAKLIVQDKNDNTNYVKFDVTGAPVDKTTYWEFTVAVTASGGTLPNAPVLAAVTAPVGGVYAAPFDALAYNGMQVNGSMEVSQELGASSISMSGVIKYVLDGWYTGTSGTQVVVGAQNTSPPPGYISGVQLTVTTANAAPAVGNFCHIAQNIEGYRMARLAWGTASAQSITIAFWVFAMRPGNYSGSVSNGAGNRTYPFSFTVSASSTWEYKTVTIPGDITGTWTKDNSIGLVLRFVAMCGTTYQGPAGAWAAALYIGATGTVNGVAATNDEIAITGVIILPGIEAPSAARSSLIMRPYDQELQLCKRHYEQVSVSIIGYQSSGSSIGSNFNFVTKRATPTFTVLSSTGNTNAAALAYFDATPSSGMVSVNAIVTGPTYLRSILTAIDARL